MEELKNSTYVDDVISGGETIKQVQKFKEESVELFSQGGFPLHKWHSSDPRFEEQKPADKIKHMQRRSWVQNQRGKNSRDEVGQSKRHFSS